LSRVICGFIDSREFIRGCASKTSLNATSPLDRPSFRPGI
jgi:hypothetical protein